MTRFAVAVALLGLAACTPEGEPDYAWRQVDASLGDGAALEVFEDRAAGVRKEVFDYGRTPVADYLFVVDNSSSMHTVIARFREGFERLAEDNPFPAKARIGVMTTLPASRDDLTRLHPAVRHSKGIKRTPGFLGLVDAGAIRTYRKRAAAKAALRFGDDGCDGWFSPTATNASGTPCIVAHTQIALASVRVEAGLTAFEQLLLKNSTRPTFRPGAAVNVIFVSDTHDPGMPVDRPSQREAALEMITERPTFSELDRLVREDNKVSSFRIHAIAPKTECSEMWKEWGPSYFLAADDAGGHTLDICTNDDYSGLITQIAEDGARLQQPVFPLGKPVSSIDKVTVDGVEVGFTDDNGVLTLDGPGLVPGKVEVTYAFDGPPTKKRHLVERDSRKVRKVRRVKGPKNPTMHGPR